MNKKQGLPGSRVDVGPMGKMQHEQRNCAFFDIDGTLLEGFMIQSFPRYLANLALIDDTYADRIDEIISNYHYGKVAYREAAETVPHLYALALKGKPMVVLENVANKGFCAQLIRSK